MIPRQPLHRGHVDAAGLLFPAAARDSRARILRILRPGDQVHELGRWLLLVLARERRMTCANAPGLPVVRIASHLSAFPVPASPSGGPPGREKSGDESPQSTGAATPGETPSLLLLDGGEFMALPLAAGAIVDPTEWLDLSELMLVKTGTLGEPEKPPVLATPEQIDSLHELLARETLPPAPEKQSFLKAALGHAARSPITAITGFAVLRVASALKEAARAVRPGTASPWATARPSAASKPGALTQAMARLEQALFFRALGGLADRANARLLEKLFSLFDQGDMDEALRHAIPIDNTREFLERAFRPAWGFGLARREPTIPLRPSPAAHRSMAFSQDPLWKTMLERLRGAYQKAFAELDRQGRYREAAYVLAELLGDIQRAVNYLAENGEAEMAARLAEARELPAHTVARLWFLAGDAEHALRVVVRSQCYAMTIVELKRTHPAEAAKLALLYARKLALAGNLVQAVDTAWDVPEAARLVEHWSAEAMRQELPHWGRVLAQRLSRGLLTTSEATTEFERLWKTGEGGSWDERFAFCDALEEKNVASGMPSTLERELFRRLLLDRPPRLSRDREERVRALLRTLPRRSGDRSLAADLPAKDGPVARSPRGALRKAREPLLLHREASGRTPIHDAVRVRAGRYLLAQGELGATLVDQSGRVLQRYDVPCHRVVASHSGTRALAIRTTCNWGLIHRLDLRLGGAVELGMLDYWFDRFQRGETYDGLRFPILAHKKDASVVQVLQVDSDRLEIISESAPLAGMPMTMTNRGGIPAVLMDAGCMRGEPGDWNVVEVFSQKPRTTPLKAAVASRSPMRPPERVHLAQGPFVAATGWGAEEGVFELFLFDRVSERYEIRLGKAAGTSVEAHFGDAPHVVCDERWIATVVNREQLSEVWILDRDERFQHVVRGKVILSGEVSPVLSLVDEQLLIINRTGQVIHLDLSAEDLLVAAEFSM